MQRPFHDNIVAFYIPIHMGRSILFVLLSSDVLSIKFHWKHSVQTDSLWQYGTPSGPREQNMLWVTFSSALIISPLGRLRAFPFQLGPSRVTLTEKLEVTSWSFPNIFLNYILCNMCDQLIHNNFGFLLKHSKRYIFYFSSFFFILIPLLKETEFRYKT